MALRCATSTQIMLIKIPICYLRVGPQVQEWASLDNATRESIKPSYSDAGILLIVSAFWSTDTPTTSGTDPITTANDLAAWVLEYELDGVDVDYEDLTAMNAGNDDAETWLATLTTALRAKLPQGDYILTLSRAYLQRHVVPSYLMLTGPSVYDISWLSPSYANEYLKVGQGVGMIDWVDPSKFYNRETFPQFTDRTWCSTTIRLCRGHDRIHDLRRPLQLLVRQSESVLFQISAFGVTLAKLVNWMGLRFR
ncbi:hypothetical protein BJ138DRAFT_1180449 [Hygrophoropsis aurantiaca]|uniref:Uncharacterized protein n=1 Tax=Hygrophoropsis aurantiaca TaxID=72124 RepID=A0ACB8AAX9_9AGAM|nr:hypothetical protein BJ138DRAFT_1180449 [Hygrophoropsis aurantiaca]